MKTPSTKPLKAAIYARISRDSEGEGKGVARQVEDCQALVERNGWEVAEVYVDNDISAAGSKQRPNYLAMIDAVRRHEVEAVVAYSNSRLTRRPLELEHWIDLHEQTGVRIATVVSGEDDLSTADGQMMARIKASIDAGEAKRTSERLTRQKASRALQGLPQGGRYRVYGYSREWEVIEDEAEVVREIFTRAAKGESASAIARDLTSRGLVTTSGKPWRSASICHLLDNALYMGKRVYRGEVIGPLAFPGLVSEDLWERASDVRQRVIRPESNWLLSGWVRCGHCGGSITGHSAKNRYRCQSAEGCGRVGVKKERLEDPVVSLILAREATRKPAGGPHGVQVGRWTSLPEIDAEIAAVRESYRQGDLDLADLNALLKTMRRDRRELETRIEEQQSSGAWGPVVTNFAWLDLDLAGRQAIVARHVSSIVLAPNEGRDSRFDPTRLTIRWADGATQQVTPEDLAAIPMRDSENERWRYPKGTATITLPPMQFTAG